MQVRNGNFWPRAYIQRPDNDVGMRSTGSSHEFPSSFLDHIQAATGGARNHWRPCHRIPSSCWTLWRNADDTFWDEDAFSTCFEILTEFDELPIMCHTCPALTSWCLIRIQGCLRTLMSSARWTKTTLELPNDAEQARLLTNFSEHQRNSFAVIPIRNDWFGKDGWQIMQLRSATIKDVQEDPLAVCDLQHHWGSMWMKTLPYRINYTAISPSTHASKNRWTRITLCHALRHCY